MRANERRNQEKVMSMGVGLRMINVATIRVATAFFVVCILSAAMAWASVGGSISGEVKDPSGRVVPGASITVREISQGLVFHARTDSKGYYKLPLLPVGRYDLSIEAIGFRPYELKAITLDTNAALTLDASLLVGSAIETVRVSDNR